MDDATKPADQFKVAIPIRVRGMSSQNKFFEEATETTLVSPQIVVTRLRNLVDLETELHVMSLKTKVGGTFRVIWVDTTGKDGFHHLGLELNQADGDLWKIRFSDPRGGEVDRGAEAWLECQRCRQRLRVPVPEADPEFFVDGFLISRPCERCKATTPWAFSVDPATETGPGGPGPFKRFGKELRRKGRVPLVMQIKVVRDNFGFPIEDVCKTLNVSRGGACFVSAQNYAVGETLKVFMPYKEGELGIPVPARVVRRDPVKDSPHLAVAIQLEEAQK